MRVCYLVHFLLKIQLYRNQLREIISHIGTYIIDHINYVCIYYIYK